MFIRIIVVHLYQQKQIIMSKTKFIKVPVSERLPVERGYYFCVVKNSTVNINVHSDLFSSYKGIEYWLCEVPDRESELIDMLEACRKEIDYLNTFQPRSSTKEFISKLETLLNEINKQS